MKHICPHCGAENTEATPLDRGPETKPVAGDCSICLDCAGLSAFAGDGTVRLSTEAERAAWMDDPGIRRIIQTTRLLLSRRKEVGHD